MRRHVARSVLVAVLVAVVATFLNPGIAFFPATSALLAPMAALQSPLVDSGVYTVVLKAGERDLRQTPVMVKGPGAEAGGGMFQVRGRS